MLKEKLTFERKEAVVLTVDFSGTTEEYALAWLRLTNNAREYSNMIWKISNTSGSNNVYVICNPKSAEAIKEFCTGIITLYDAKTDQLHCIGKVINEETITVGVPTYEYESTCWTDDPQWEKDMDSAVLEWLAVDSD